MKWALAVALVLLALLGAGGALLCENALRLPPSMRPQPDPALAARIAGGVAWSEVSIAGADGTPLRAWYFAPPNATRTVLIFHGVADSRRGAAGLASIFLPHRYAVLVPDSRAHGSSGGDIFTFGLRESDDVLAWARWAQQQPAGAQLYALGESMGAGILLQATARQAPFRAIAAECPFATFPLVARHRVSQKIGLPAPLFTQSALLYARLKYNLDFDIASPLALAPQISIPTLLIHGLADTNIPPHHSQLLAQSNPRFQLWLVPQATHTSASTTAPAEFQNRLLTLFQ